MTAPAAQPGAATDFPAILAPLLPGIAARTAEADRLRDTPPATIAELRQAGLLRMFQPARWGGHEAHPGEFLGIQNRIAEHCPSSAWVFGVLNVQSLVVALFSDQAQADVWASNPAAVICSSFPPTGTAIPDADGFRLSGRWTFASGSTFADWALLGAKLPATPGVPAAVRLFLVPRADFQIVDVWHTFGMRGTGSNDIVATDIVVPGHRMLQLDPGVQTVVRSARPGAALYRLPWLYLFTSAISNLAIGTARGALAAFVAFNRTRVSPMSGKAAKDDPAVQQAAARLLAEIDTAEAMYARHIDRLLAHAQGDVAMPLDEGWLYRTQLTSALRAITARLDDLMLLQGARAINLDSPVARAWLDLSAARAHIGNDPAMSSITLGGALLNG